MPITVGQSSQLLQPPGHRGCKPRFAGDVRADKEVAGGLGLVGSVSAT